MKTVCIIPARGGSKRIPGKNIRNLCGKPLIAHTIDTCIDSKIFDTVMVTSDDDQIIRVARDHDADTDRRPDHLSGDTVKAVEVILEFLQRPEHKDKWDVVAMCLPTCPFRTASDIQAAMTVFEQERHKCAHLISVVPCDFPPQLALKKQTPATITMREPAAYEFSTRSQDIERLFYPNGAIYISSIPEFIRIKSFFSQQMLMYEMPAERSFDIDYEYQFSIAECMMNKIISSKG